MDLPAACVDKKEASRDDRETCYGGKRGAREPFARGGSVAVAPKNEMKIAMAKHHPAHICALGTEGWQVAIDAKLFYQYVGGYFSLFC
jgi:hypothetical protein